MTWECVALLTRSCLGALLHSPSGDLFCKECIYGNLLTQRERLEEQKRLFEDQEKERLVRWCLLRAGCGPAAVRLPSRRHFGHVIAGGGEGEGSSS